MYNKLSFAVAAATYLAATSLPAAAQQEKPFENQQDKEIDQILVVGVKADNFNVAVTDDFIVDRQIVDLEGMFRHEPSITVGGGLPVAQKIYVRGLEDTLLNVTIDGATQSGYLYHHQGRINVEPELIKQVVIEAGAGKATAGPGAIGGAIHFETADAKDLLEDGTTFGGSVKTNYHSVNDGTKYTANLFVAPNEHVGLLISASQFETDNYEDGNGDEVEQSAVEQDSLFLKGSVDISTTQYVSLSYETRSDNGVRFSRPNMVGLFHPVYPSLPVPQATERESIVGNYRFNPETDAININATAYKNENTITKQGDLFLDHWPPSPPFTFTDYYNGAEHGGGVDSIGLTIKNTGVFSDHQIEYGIEWRNDEAFLINGVVSGFQTEVSDIYAIFAQTDLVISPLLAVSLGARYDNFDYTDNQGVNFTGSKTSPNLNFKITPNDQLEMYIGYAKAFKGIGSPEVFFLEFPPAGLTLTNYTGPNIASGNFTLGAVEPEVAENIELGFRFQSGQFSASGEIFQQDIENAQVTSPTARQSYKDLVEADGYALRVGYQIDTLSLNIGVSETEPTIGGEPLSSGDMGLGTAYGRTWTAGAEYQFVDAGVTIGWNSRAVEELDFVQSNQDRKDGYSIHDLFTTWEISPQFKLGASISNLTDKFYYDQGTFYSQAQGGTVLGLPEPGRNIKASLSVSF